MLKLVKQIPNKCTIYLVFDRDCFEAVLIKNTRRTLGIKDFDQKALVVQ
jgi:hypothetical protein